MTLRPHPKRMNKTLNLALYTVNICLNIKMSAQEGLPLPICSQIQNCCNVDQAACKHHLPAKVIFHQRLSSSEGCLPPKVVFYLWSSPTKDCLPPKFVLHQRLSTYHNTLFDLIFVRKVKIQNLSLLSCLDVAKQKETRAHMLLLLRTTKISKAMIFLKSNLSKVSKKTFVRAGQCACLPCANNLIFVQYFYNLLINIHLIVDPNVTPEFRVDTPFCLNPNATCPSKFNLL